jgi:hypothetical protein
MKTILKPFVILLIFLIPFGITRQGIAQTDNASKQKQQQDIQKDKQSTQEIDFELQKKKMENQKEKIEAQRIAFITNRLDLTPAEAQVFWPIYNEFDAKRREITKQFRKFRPETDLDGITDKQAAELAENQLVEAQKMLDLRKEYHARLKSILPPKKLLLLYDSEREFQKHLIDRIRDGGEPGQGKGPGNGQGSGNQKRAGNRDDAPN